MTISDVRGRKVCVCSSRVRPQLLQELIRPLTEAYGVHYFSYKKISSSGASSFITTHPRVASYFDHYLFDHVPFLGDFESNSAGVYLLSSEENIRLAQGFHKKMDVGACLIFKMRRGKCIEFFFFGVPPHLSGAEHVYVNYKFVFEKFSLYFKSKICDCFKGTEESFVQHPAALSSQESVSENLLEFFASYHRQKLTKRELVCASYLSQLVPMKEIAVNMQISLGTLEKHVASIKAKLQCRHVAVLIVKLRHQLRLPQFFEGPQF